jgi:hypothetical protein
MFLRAHLRRLLWRGRRGCPRDRLSWGLARLVGLTKERCYLDGVTAPRCCHVLCCFLWMVGALCVPSDSARAVSVFLDVQEAGFASINSLSFQDLRLPCLVEVGDADEEITLVLIFEYDGNQSGAPCGRGVRSEHVLCLGDLQVSS